MVAQRQTYAKIMAHLATLELTTNNLRGEKMFIELSSLL
jgi:hypothetical protein